MQINSITECCKPKKISNFQGLSAVSDKSRVRYKHLDVMPQEALMSRSITKAHESVKKSGKMQLYKALPAITTGVIATSLAITQPGKLSSKVAQGLGFLALSKGVDFATDLISKKSDKDQSFNFLAGLGATLGAIVAGSAILKGLSNVKALDGVTKFVKAEAGKLASEINSTKLSNFSDKYIQPILNKYPRASVAALYTSVIATSFANGNLQSKLAASLSNDVKVKSEENFEKAKKIQQIAREHFDSIDAKEV